MIKTMIREFFNNKAPLSDASFSSWMAITMISTTRRLRDLVPQKGVWELSSRILTHPSSLLGLVVSFSFSLGIIYDNPYVESLDFRGLA